MSLNAITAGQFDKLQSAIVAAKGKRGAVMTTLQEAMSIIGYVPYEVQVRIAEGLDVPLSEVYGVATFYSQFALKPRGKHIISVCMGTACYVKGSKAVLEKLVGTLGVPVGESTPDYQFTLNATRCLGCCGLAPVIMINEDVYGRLTADEIPTIVEKYKSA